MKWVYYSFMYDVFNDLDADTEVLHLRPLYTSHIAVNIKCIMKTKHYHRIYGLRRISIRNNKQNSYFTKNLFQVPKKVV